MKRREDGTLESKLIQGLSNKPIGELLPLARSWLQSAELKLNSKGFRGEGYSRSERAYIVSNTSGQADTLTFELNANESSPVVNPAFVVKNWGDGGAELKIDGRRIKRGKNFCFGHRHSLEGTDVVIWVKTESTKPIQISFSPIRNGNI
jgi:hypothetical protein